MNAAYRRYRTDERFRAALLACAHRHRTQAIAGFFAAAGGLLFSPRKRPASRPHLARPA